MTPHYGHAGPNNVPDDLLVAVHPFQFHARAPRLVMEGAHSLS